MELTDTILSNTPDDVAVQADDSAYSTSAVNTSAIDPPEPTPDGLRNTVPERTEYGQNLRLAMACMDGAERLRSIKAAKVALERTEQPRFDVDETLPPPPSNQTLSTQLQSLSAEVDTHRAELVELLEQFDEQQGWAAVGARNCAEWANAYLGIAKVSAYAYLKVGRELRELPIIRVLFRGGELSWSKVRLLVAVADADNERQLAHASIDATVADVIRICKSFRWKKTEQTVDPDDDRLAEDIAADLQLRNRAVTWRELPDGSTAIHITLPPEKAQVVLKSLEHCENELYEGQNQTMPSNEDVEASKNEADSVDRPTFTQLRADALVLMAERSLEAAGSDVSRTDRYQVILHVDKNDLAGTSDSLPTQAPEIPEQDTHDVPKSLHVENFSHPPFPGFDPCPTRRPWVEGAGPIAQSVARRITCDCSVVGMLFNEGEPLNVGRKTRVWPIAIWRAIVARDRHCQFPGCNEHRHLDIHHIIHWADGGETSVTNGISLCHRHHSLVHEGGYRIKRILPTDMQSRDKVLIPTRHRFRFIRPPTLNTSNLSALNAIHVHRSNTDSTHNDCA